MNIAADRRRACGQARSRGSWRGLGMVEITSAQMRHATPLRTEWSDASRARAAVKVRRAPQLVGGFDYNAEYKQSPDRLV